jgi:hypothetical protein
MIEVPPRRWQRLEVPPLATAPEMVLTQSGKTIDELITDGLFEKIVHPDGRDPRPTVRLTPAGWKRALELQRENPYGV